MGYSSFSFDPSDIGKGSDASSKIASKSATWDKASAASSVAALASNTASAASVAAAAASNTASAASVAAAKGSDASSKIASKSATWDKASAASSVAAAASNTASAASVKADANSTAASSALAMLGSAIFSNPGDSSFVVKDIIVTTSGEIKYRYSTTAVGD